MMTTFRVIVLIVAVLSALFALADEKENRFNHIALFIAASVVFIISMAV